MRIVNLCSKGIGIATAIVILFAAVKPASADTYQIFNLSSDQGYLFYGMDDSGNVVINNLEHDRYQTFVDGISTGYSSSTPTIVADSGTPCTPAVPSGSVVLNGVCNGDHEAFTGKLTPDQFFAAVYIGAAPVPDLLSGSGGGSIFMDGSGDIVWDDIYSENWFEAVDQTSAVPEPSSLLLFGTGVLAAMGAVRRRLLQ
ncbi:PEP-CTERM sorting domain-containing protein [Edaphobacter dinghuensis]|uniref:Ice-binding protein C-terminal domain-containing protein n=1 Tax=Edaphobacter dinghuensis TaxID=1560005 RepID=A0A917H0T0_9BACT|nr:PEP-CTERM sorting domain-containing protein [Edaphobacter dinghuensis]GGG64277.1 hypothetical protein GCM10011585_02320 [Edaphobacter dinghuensis]